MTTRRLHRALAWPVLAILGGWVAGGLMHVLMTWTQPQAVTMAPPMPGEAVTLAHSPIGEALAAAGRTEVTGLRLLRHEDALLLRVRDAQSARALYLHPDGSPASPDTDEMRARRLAKHYLGTAVLSDARPVAAFDSEYSANQRLLPVWRVSAEDGRVVFVDTDADRLAGLSDPWRYRLQQGFRVLHLLSPLEAWPTLRRLLITVLQTAVLGMAAMGIWMLLRSAGGRSRVRRRHRVLAGIALVPMLAFAATGLWHLWVKAGSQLPAPLAPEAVATQGLGLPGGRFEELRLMPVGEQAYWRGLVDGTAHYFTADGSARIGWDDAQAAQAMAAAHGFEGARAVREVQRFDADYAFLNRRLPVWRLRADDTLVHIDHRSGWLVSATDPMARAESRVFSAVHKGQWMDPAGRVVRDGVLSAAAVWLLLAAASGVRLRRRS